MKKYQIIYADPPWSYKDKSKIHGGGAESHYPCMSIKQICELKIPTDDNAVLLLWTTYPQLEEAFKVINAWGFTYKTGAFTWIKCNKDKSIYMGMGRYTRANAEICLLAVKGKGIKRQSASIYNTQIHKRKQHSEKPEQFKKDIVKLFGDLPRIELFARRKEKDGWDYFGNEVESDIDLTPLNQ
jgi:N6-adenosine-specific RNA methylase IME4